MLRTMSRRASELVGTPTRAMTESEGQSSSSAPKSSLAHQRKKSASTPAQRRVTFKVKAQTWGAVSPSPSPSTSTSRPRAVAKAAQHARRASSDPTHTKQAPPTKRQSRFASLFISMLAVSPMAIEMDAADQKTIEAATKAATNPVQTASQPKKAYTRPVNGVKPAEIRRARWKRFKYEIGLKMKSRGKGKGKRKEWRAVEDDQDLELEELEAEQRERGLAKLRDMI